jgi:hypothetical protein
MNSGSPAVALKKPSPQAGLAGTNLKFEGYEESYTLISTSPWMCQSKSAGFALRRPCRKNKKGTLK